LSVANKILSFSAWHAKFYEKLWEKEGMTMSCVKWITSVSYNSEIFFAQLKGIMGDKRKSHS